MSHSSLWDIPENVFEEDLFPLLSVNELLHLRRLCKWTKELSEGYLRRVPRSKTTCWIDLNHTDFPSTAHGKPSKSLKEFLNEDITRSIRIPTSRFELEFSTTDVLQDSPVFEFLKRYGNQIKKLGFECMNFPMTEDEWNFFEKTPNLNKLSVSSLKERGGAQCVNTGFPEVFNQLASLRIFSSELLPESNCIPEIFKFCKNLKLFYSSEASHRDMDEIAQILEPGQHKRFQYYDVTSLDKSYYHNPLNILSEMAVKYNFRLKNVQYEILNEKSLLKNAHTISSLLHFRFDKEGLYSCEVLDLISFPSVDKVRLFISAEPADCYYDPFQMTFEDQNEVMSKMMTPTRFPALKNLTISTGRKSGVTAVLAQLWRFVPNLEEICFTACSAPGDKAFIGENGDRPFLQLMRLHKLDLGVIDTTSKEVLTDTSFIQVFRNMRLREFSMASEKPLQQITSEGILALLTGPFVKTIEKFSFLKWSLEDTNAVEFSKLRKKFPNNQPF